MNTIPIYYSELINLQNREKVPYTVRFVEKHDFFTPHRHNFLEFAYVVKGNGIETINNRRHLLKPGVFSLVLPYQIHILEGSLEEPLSFFTGAITLDALFIADEFWKGFASLLFRSDANLPCHHLFEGTEADRMFSICEEMLKAYEEKTERGDLMFKVKLMESLLVFDQKRSEKISGSSLIQSSLEPEKSKSNLFWRIVHHVQTHYCEHLSLSELARNFNTSPSYISFSFKKYLGTGYVDFLNDVRLQNACALLVSTDMPVIDIAFESGFESYSTFSRIFRKAKQLTAREYRNAALNRS